MNKGLIGILILLILLIAISGGGFYVYKNPEVKDQILQKLNATFQPSSNEQFISPLSLARDQERREGVKSISDNIFQYTSENKGLLPTDFPTEETCIGIDPNCYDLSKLLIPNFIDQIPKDPENGTDANTGFTTYKNSDGRVVVSIKGENGGVFEIVR